MTEFICKPPESVPPIAQNATISFKFSQRIAILDEWYIFGGTRLSRSIFRIRHPIVYSKRGLRKLWRKIKYTFVKEPPAVMCRKFISKEEALHEWPKN